MKNITTLRPALLTLCGSLFLSLLANNAKAELDTWDPTGTATPATGGTWENASWDTANQTGTASPTHFNEGAAANWAFGAAGGAASTFTVTMNASHTVAGWFNGPLTPKSCFVTVTGTGTIVLPNKTVNPIQGFDTAGSTLGESIFNVPIADTSGTILILEGGGQQFFNGANTYVGGTYVGYATSSGTGIQNFNSSASFGTGTITFSNCAAGAFVVEGSSAVTIPNKVVWNHLGLNPTYNYVGNPAGVTYSGTWSLGTNTPKIGSGGGAANINIISGVISSSGSPAGGIIAWSTAGGTLEYNNTMTYTGATVVSNIVVLALGPNGNISGTGAVTVQTNATLADTNTSGINTIAGSLTFSALSSSPAQAAGKAIFNASGSTAGSISVGGNLTLNTTPITVNVGSALAVGTYRLISCTGTVTGSAKTPPTITGLALATGETAAISTTTGAGGHVDLVITGTAPSVNCPTIATVNNTPPSCTVSEAFAATATGYPVPTITYTIPGPTTITSPYNFPVGTTTVTTTASNGLSPNATCQFTVTVNDLTTSTSGAFAIGPVEGVTETLPLAKILTVDTISAGTLSISGVTSPTPNGGTASLDGFGNMLYTSAGNLNADTITYQLSDQCGTQVGTGTIAVNTVPNGTGNNGISGSSMGGNLNLSAFGIPGDFYTLQYAPSLTYPVTWTTATTTSPNPAQAGANGVFTFTIVGGPNGYYRTAGPSGNP